jgi:membrane protein YqaA with SNARE-associated domain
LAWLPIGGDALTLIAGTMKVRLSVFIILVGAGKAARYISIVVLNDWFLR